MSKQLNVRNLSSIVFLNILALLLVTSISIAQNTENKSTSNVVLKSEVKWDHLNPKRGDKAPKAGTLWGDRNGSGPTGFLLKPTDGFKSPPHIHNVSYRGIVISGLIHNDDPNAADMWMPAGSFWTQPKGEVHITAAKGSNTLAYIEIENGPYLVLPSNEAFDSGERPVNVDPSNIVWLGKSEIRWVKQSGKSVSKRSPEVAFLWGRTQNGQLHGSLIKLPAGFNGKILSNGTTFKAVVIDGLPGYQITKKSESKILEPGSYFSSESKSVHFIKSNEDIESIIYVRTDGKFEVIQTK